MLIKIRNPDEIGGLIYSHKYGTLQRFSFNIKICDTFILKYDPNNGIVLNKTKVSLIANILRRFFEGIFLKLFCERTNTIRMLPIKPNMVKKGGDIINITLI